MTGDKDGLLFGANSATVWSLGRSAQFIQFCLEEGVLLTIWADGRIEKGPAFTTDDDASLKFWEILEKSFGWPQKEK